MNLKQSAERAREQARKQIEGAHLPNLRDVHLDDIDWHVFQKREEEAASKGFLGGFLLGALVGAVLALVFAPRRGDETRELVAGAASDLRERATDLVGHARHETDDAVQQVANDGPAIEREIGDAAETIGDPFGEARSSS